MNGGNGIGQLWNPQWKSKNMFRISFLRHQCLRDITKGVATKFPSLLP
jgi:hypothetical protein